MASHQQHTGPVPLCDFVAQSRGCVVHTFTGAGIGLKAHVLSFNVYVCVAGDGVCGRTACVGGRFHACKAHTVRHQQAAQDPRPRQKNVTVNMLYATGHE